jgi:FKBP-type peptidyl-prolyl cis-trans isomerase 2
MEEGSFIYVDLTGKVKESGEVFETTKEEVARAAGIFNQKFKYKPLLVIVGSRNILPSLENVIKGMQVGEKKVVELEPKNAFGERREELIKLFNISLFKQRNVEIYPGASITINGLIGRVISISGGRVKVDFNHPLAGKTVIYEVEIKGEIKDINEKISAIVTHYSDLEKEEFSLKISEKVVEIDTKSKDLPIEAKEIIAESIKRWVGMEKVKFISYF